MRERKDGKDTRDKLIKAACEVFGERGFHQATHSEICRLAKTNTASINYHFGSKEELYRAVWHHTNALMQQRYPAREPQDEGLDPASRLGRFIYRMLEKTADRDLLGYSHRLLLLEISHPSGLVDDLLLASRKPYQIQLQGIIRELMDEPTSASEIELCERSVVGQIKLLRFDLHRALDEGRPLEGELRRLSEHILRFSLAGIGAVSRSREEAQ